MSDFETYCRMNIDVAFHLGPDELKHTIQFEEICELIKEALKDVVDDVYIDTDSFEVLD